ncbi:putative signaling protein [Hydrogenovibrio crunogenus]|uniref:Putative signaling protein n=1 Tax=Hydrogenovibrio crunogenus TaxID=39765 RepID=A0A4P7P3K8_9GAMM|nr:putative signaling protein [Hydrogenovibrio crunogenus]
MIISLKKLLRTSLFLVVLFCHTGVAYAVPTFDEFFERQNAVMLIMHPVTGKIVRANRAAETFYGYSRDELKKMSIQDLNTLTPKQISKELALAREEKRNYFIFRHRLADGSTREVAVHSIPYSFGGQSFLVSTIHELSSRGHQEKDLQHYQSNLEELLQRQEEELEQSKERQSLILVLAVFAQALLILFLFYDISRRKQLQAELKQVATTLTNIMDSSTEVAVIATDTEGVITEFNSGAEKLLGYSSGELVGQETPLKFHSQKEVETRAQKLSKALKRPITGFQVFTEKLTEESPHDHEWTYVRKDGVRVPVSLIVTPILDENHQKIGYLGVAQDITELRRSQQALVEARNQLEATLDTIPDLLFEVDKEGRILNFHTADIKKLYLKPEQFVGKKVNDVLPESVSDVIAQAMTEALETGRSHGLEYSLAQHGKLSCYELSVSTKTNQQNEVVSFIFLSRDVTTRVRQSEELAEKDERLELILSASKIGQWDWDIDNNVMLWDERSYTMLGYQPEAFKVDYDKWASLLHPDDAYVLKRLKAHLEKGETYSVDYRLRSGDGDWVWIESQGQTVEWDAEGQPTRMVGIHMDITERKHSEDLLVKNEERLRTIFEILPIGVTLTDKEGQIVECNSASEVLLGISREEHLARKYDAKEWTIYRADGTVMPPEEFASVRSLKDQVTVKNQIMKVCHTDGCVWLSVSATPLNHPVYGLVVSYIDISDKREAEERLNLAASVFTHAREGIMITDKHARIIDVNKGFTQITGYERDEVLGLNPNILNSGCQSKEFYNLMWKTLFEEDHWSGEIWNRNKHGVVYPQMITITAIKNSDGMTQNYLALFTDITSLKEQQKQLEHIAHYDVLTQLPNRSLLADRLQQAIFTSQRHNSLLAVLFIDLDGFKKVNDQHGHDAGDELLIELSKRMKIVLREEDTLARIGGDEFVVVLVNLDAPKDCEMILRRLLASTSEPVEIEGESVSVSASIGVTFYPTDNVDTDQLMRHADQAMYQAKQSGKNRYHYFDVQMDSMLQSQGAIQNEMQEALRQEEFELYYQPKVNLAQNTVIGVEALIRWNHPKRGVLTPHEFLPFIENHPFSVELDQWVMATALKQMSEWRSQ